MLKQEVGFRKQKQIPATKLSNGGLAYHQRLTSDIEFFSTQIMMSLCSASLPEDGYGLWRWRKAAFDENRDAAEASLTFSISNRSAAHNDKGLRARSLVQAVMNVRCRNVELYWTIEARERCGQTPNRKGHLHL